MRTRIRDTAMGWSVAVSLVAASLGSAQPARFPAVTNDVAWKSLPREDPPLPVWARILVQPLPRTTAGMLELDFIHRAGNPLGPVLAAKLRWAAADAIDCDYARCTAEADLRRAGLTKDDPEKATPADRAALAFARKMTRAAHTITDEEMAELLQHFGPERVTAIVHTLAFANFQNRIYLALAVNVEPGGPLPPLDVRLDPVKRTQVTAPSRPEWEVLLKRPASFKSVAPSEWSEKSIADIEKALERQKERKPRIPLPDLERMTQVPPEAKEQASKIVWTSISMGYQPMLTKAWFDCMRTFQQESKLDRVFANSMFWVITRSNECFY